MQNVIRVENGKYIGEGVDTSVIGNLQDLTTTDKSSVVGAINEVNGKASIVPVTFTPDSTSISLDWGSFQSLSGVLISSFGILLTSGCTAGTELRLGSLDVNFPSNISVPVFNVYGSVEYLGQVLFYYNGNLGFVPAITTSNTVRIMGSVINPIG